MIRPSARRRVSNVMFWGMSVIVGGLLCLAGLLLSVYLRGHAFSPARDLNALYPQVADDDNAAPLFMKAFEAIVEPSNEIEQALSSEDRRIPTDPLPPSEAELATLDTLLTRNDEALGLLYEAASKPACRYPIDLNVREAWVDESLHHGRGVRYAARLLRLQAIYCAARHEPGEAARALECMLSSIASVRNEPRLIAVAIVMNGIGMFHSGLQRVLAMTAMTDDQLSQLDRALASIDLAEHMKIMLRSWPELMGYAFDNPAIYWDDIGSSPNEKDGLLRRATEAVKWRGYTWLGVAQEDRAAFAAALARVLPAQDKPFPASIAATDLVGQQVDALPAWQSEITRNELSHLSYLQRSLGYCTAQILLARTALAIERFRNARGAPPDRLSDLVPDFAAEIFKDPFSGTDLRYRRNETGYTLYSIGMNWIDDSGKRSDTGNPGVGDIVLTVVR